MKRLLSALLLILLVFPTVALAEVPFTLRNGYHWDMPEKDVLALADQEGLVKNEHNDKVIRFNCVPVGDFFTQMTLILDNSFCLEYVVYDFPDISNAQEEEYRAMFDYLIRSLQQVYGLADSQKEYESAVWRLPDTEITLFAYYLPTDQMDVNRWTLMYRSKESVQNSGF